MLAGLVLVAMLLLAGTLPRTGRYGAAALVLTSVLWLIVNKDRMEGAILWTVSAHHGLTAGDLVGIAGIALGAWTLWKSRQGPPLRRD